MALTSSFDFSGPLTESILMGNLTDKAIVMAIYSSFLKSNSKWLIKY